MKFNWVNKLLRGIYRNHKDLLFRTIFGSEKYKKYTLQLYNAINHTSYDDPSQLELITLKGAIYVTVKNDLAFLISSSMEVYEHQSSVNPNMPLRGFTYFGELYNKYISMRNLNIYGKKPIKIPTPQYIVLYNGTEDVPDVQELKLSDAFITKTDDGKYEWTAKVYNINLDHNKKLLGDCEPLYGYSLLIDKYRRYSESMPPFKAMDRAVLECIEEGYLVDVLKEERSAAMMEILTTYNKKAYEEDLREEGREEMREVVRQKDEEMARKDEEIRSLREKLRKYEE